MTEAIIAGIIILMFAAIIVVVVYAAAKKTRSLQLESSNRNTSWRKFPEEQIKETSFQNSNKVFPVSITKTHSKPSDYNDSIIDVTGQVYRLNSTHHLKKVLRGVPSWDHQYVYSYSAISYASLEQKQFYGIFRRSFLSGDPLDLEGNTNYAFVLLFDLLNDYENHKDLGKLESQLKSLGQSYPKTKSYGISFLIERMERDGYSDAFSRLNQEDSNNQQNYYSSYNYWKLGSKYKSKLSLRDEDVELLNNLSSPNNNFCSIEFCFVEVLKLFLKVISALKERCESEGTTIEKEFLFVSDVIARKEFKFRNGSPNYRYSLESTKNDFYLNIFKHCENAVREIYRHSRKLNSDIHYVNAEAKTEFVSRIGSRVSILLPTLISNVSPPDEATELELNSRTTSRWKLEFEEIAKTHKDNPSKFVDAVVNLGRLNSKNPSIENIFFEASKFIAKYDNVSSITLYVHYLYHDLKSTTFENKQLTKTIQKCLFKTNEQLRDFELILSHLIKDKDLNKALTGAQQIFQVKRKTIKLDRAKIEEVQEQHVGTVELLNEYLRDEFEDETTAIKSEEINNEEIRIEIFRKQAHKSHNAAFLNELSLEPIQASVLELFSKYNFSILQSEIEEFARSKGVFRNQVIESINEACYEVLDDVLIEEEDEYYTIIPEYFHKISIK